MFIKGSSQVAQIQILHLELYHGNLIKKCDCNSLSDILLSLSFQEISYILTHPAECRIHNMDQEEEVERSLAYLRKHA
jgi:hypothetical protein